jgi:flagellar biosynthesis/type III secretory pathway protein FliH
MMVQTAKPYLPREFRVPLNAQIRHATLVSSNSLLPPLSACTPKPVDSSHVSEPTSSGTVQPPDFWLTEIGQQLAVDRKSIEATLQAVRDGVDEFRKQHLERLGEWQKAAVELAMSIVAKVLHERVTADQFPLEAMIRDMAGEMHEDEILSVRLNPRDLQLLEQRLDGEPLFPGLADPKLLVDATLGRAECRVEGRSTVTVSDLPRQLSQFREDLLGSLAHARS